ncbi:nuclear transport factor 2 family protein [Sphingomonas sp. KR3-1]|uniref:nuclear transport factor 2 family protein n=1 Tax=Sphingomonas sp. KR3-1 TaxID=3156611 RepID=UPI0032B52D89
MEDVVKQLLLRNLHEVFGERDSARRRAAIQAIYAPDARFADPEGSHVGWDGVEMAAAALQAATPGFVFGALGAAEAVQNAGRLRWAYGPAGEPEKVTGMDVAVVEDGLIRQIYTFVDR